MRNRGSHRVVPPSLNRRGENVAFFAFLAFQCRIPNYSTAKTREDMTKSKRKTIARLFFIFWIRSNIFRDFSGCRRSILIFEIVIRFVCVLAFQCGIPNYSTANTREDMAKRKRKVENDCSFFFFFIFWIRSNIFRDFSGCRR